MLVLAAAPPASAQLRPRWSTIYAGGDVGTPFGMPDFTVDFDATPGHSGGSVDGPVNPGVTFGVRVGVNRQFADRFVVGGEVGFGKFGYRGEASFADVAFGVTTGRTYWSAVGRMGYVLGDIMPYGGGGVSSGSNTAEVRRCGSSACGTILADGSNTIWATTPIFVAGLEIAPGRRVSGVVWSIRVEWAQVFRREIANSFVETIRTGPDAPRPGFPVEVVSRLPSGMIRVLVDIGIRR